MNQNSLDHMKKDHSEYLESFDRQKRGALSLGVDQKSEVNSQYNITKSIFRIDGDLGDDEPPNISPFEEKKPRKDSVTRSSKTIQETQPGDSEKKLASNSKHIYTDGEEVRALNLKEIRLEGHILMDEKDAIQDRTFPAKTKKSQPKKVKEKSLSGYLSCFKRKDGRTKSCMEMTREMISFFLQPVGIFWVSVILGWLSFICCGVAPTFLYLKNSEMTNALDQSQFELTIIITNLLKSPILDLQIMNGTFCPNGYTSVGFENWVGTTRGCFCSNDILKPSSCTRYDNSSTRTCYEYSEIQPQLIYNWKGLKLCMKRATENVDYVIKQKCPSDKKMCYPSYCFNTTINCPLTSFIVSDTQTSDEFYSSNNKYINLYREITKAPIIEIGISNYDIPCFNRARKPLNPTMPTEYILLRTSATGCDNYGVEQFAGFADNSSLYDLLKSNNLPKAVFDLPYYGTNLNKTSSFLYFENKIGIKNQDECFTPPVEILDSFRMLSLSLPRLLSIISISVFGIGILIVIAYIIHTSILKGDTKDFFFLFGLTTFCFGLLIVSNLFSIPFQYYNKIDLMETLSSQFKTLIEKNCILEPQILGIFNNYFSNIDIIKQTTEWIDIIFYASISAVGSTLVALIMRKIKNRR